MQIGHNRQPLLDMDNKTHQYLDERNNIYSGHVFPIHPMVEGLPLVYYTKENDYEGLQDNRLQTKNIDSKNFFNRIKAKLNLVKHGSQHMEDDKNRKLWEMIRDRPIQDENLNPNIEPSKFWKSYDEDHDIENKSHNSFFKRNINESELKNLQLPSVSDKFVIFSTSKRPDDISIEEFLNGIDSNIKLNKLTDKVWIKKASVKDIQKRLNELSNKKIEVIKLYNKLGQDFTNWSNQCVDTEEGSKLLDDLQKILELDMMTEAYSALKFKEVSQGLEFVKKREDQMLQEKKLFQTESKAYEQVKLRKGEKDEETQYLKEVMMTRQKSLFEIKTLYEQALSKSFRDLFTRTCITFYENASNIKEVTRTFLNDSLTYLKEHYKEESVNDLIKDIQKRCADRQWAKLSFEERHDPNKLAEIMGKIYNGEDSLLRGLTKTTNIKFSPIVTGIDESQEKEYNRPKGKPNLGNTWSQFPSERCNGISSNECFQKKLPGKTPSKQNLQPIHSFQQPSLKFTNPYDFNQTLQGISELPFSNNSNFHKSKESNIGFFSRPSSKLKINRPSSQLMHQGPIHEDNVIIKFGNNNTPSLSRKFLEAEEELKGNKWEGTSIK